MMLLCKCREFDGGDVHDTLELASSGGEFSFYHHVGVVSDIFKSGGDMLP